MSNHAKRKRELRRSIESELERLGIKPEFAPLDGHHQLVEFTINGRRQRYGFAGSGNWREPRWVIANIRRLVREARA